MTPLDTKENKDASSAGATENLKVLIVDDCENDIKILRRHLSHLTKSTQFTFDEARSGKEALSLMERNTYECIFLDCVMNDISGLEILRKLNDPNSVLQQSPCVLLTGHKNQHIMIDALRLGAQDCLMKENISHNLLIAAITKAREIFELKKSWKQASEQIHHSRKMEAVGQLTSGVAHDFNNLLTVIMGNIHLLRRRLNQGITKPEELDDKIRAVEIAANKGADLVRRLMVFTRQTPLSQEVADVNNCITETFELLRRTLGEAIEIETILTEDPWPVSIDVSEFDNIMINFAVNARDAMPRGGKLTIETINIVLDESYTLQNPDVSPGPYVMIAISDTGVGMPPEVLSRVFEPFFTTKEAGEGTGLGMSMAYGFVRQCGGHIYAYSEPGHGTVFRIYLPRVLHESEVKDLSGTQPYPTGSETILIAEDDEIVRSVTASMLEKMGYKTLQAQNGRVALEMLKREHKNIDLVFTDIVMPGGISGIELVRKMREYYRGVKVLYTSGYTENAIPDYQLCAGEELISKPYRKETLARKVRKVLDTEARA